VSAARTAPPDSAPAWTDPLYRPLLRLPHRGVRQRFGPVEADVSVVDTPPDSVAAQWLPDRAILLTVDDAAGPAELARALPSFRAYASALGGRPATPMVTLPSRDVDRCRVAREQGFAPRAMLLVCPLPRPAVVPTPPPAGVRARPAELRDADAITELWWAQAEYEARIGTLRFTPAIRAAIRRATPGLLAGDGDVLVAERDGRPVAVLGAAAAGVSGPAALRLRATAAGYVMLASTAAAERGRGIGGTLVRELHRRSAAQGVELSTLHCSAFNPLAVPFWSQHGYRPLLTTFVSPL
jgi:GNAT superfamily N-acetyltransferase